MVPEDHNGLLLAKLNYSYSVLVARIRGSHSRSAFEERIRGGALILAEDDRIAYCASSDSSSIKTYRIYNTQNMVGMSLVYVRDDAKDNGVE